MVAAQQAAAAQQQQNQQHLSEANVGGNTATTLSGSGGVSLTATPTQQQHQQQVSPMKENTPKRLHVSNIPFRFRDPDLRNMFGVRRGKHRFRTCK